MEPSEELDSGEDLQAEVRLHIYHCDPFTGFLNRLFLARRGLGIYHAGVEVFGQEWSFGFFEDTWNKPFISGVTSCSPRQMPGYTYRESVELGPTAFSERQVEQLLVEMQGAWPACTYHLTRKNCLTFAERLSHRLQTPQPFPEWLQGILEASKQYVFVDTVVDCSWSLLKRRMIRKHQLPKEPHTTRFCISRAACRVCASVPHIARLAMRLFTAFVRPSLRHVQIALQGSSKNTFQGSAGVSASLICSPSFDFITRLSKRSPKT